MVMMVVVVMRGVDSGIVGDGRDGDGGDGDARGDGGGGGEPG